MRISGLAKGPNAQAPGCAGDFRTGPGGSGAGMVGALFEEWVFCMVGPDLDVIIIGAGLSGIGVARYLKVECPEKSFAVLEAKPRMGGTWDQFRYPGIRSDSDMHTMGYAFKPWRDAKAIADGPAILSYVKETAREYGIDAHVRYGHRVIRADYSTAKSMWTLTVEHDGETRRTTARFLLSCAGYYRHEEAYAPDFPGLSDYGGQVVHPQFWPEGLDHAGKRIAIIGSGATAVTLTPTLAERAAHVWQIQRTPTYVVNRPAKDRVGNLLKAVFPGRLGYGLTRWKVIWEGRLRRRRFVKDIKGMKALLIGNVGKELAADLPDWEAHFTPPYWPGQQRICVVPDGDMFHALRQGKATMVTGEIETFTETGLRMAEGTEIEADIVITATGLVLETLGGAAYAVDGQAVSPGKLLVYKGFMYSNLPNLIYVTGYTNASWTLKVDLVAEYALGLLKHMDATGATQVVPRAGPEDFASIATAIKFTSGYFLRVRDRLPKHGTAFPWVHEQEYFWDRKTLKRGRVDDGTLSFSTGEAVVFPPEQRGPDAAELAAE
jgi:cation diffusion facilitator CzcD-associated flavoprotein CzcO